MKIFRKLLLGLIVLNLSSNVLAMEPESSTNYGAMAKSYAQSLANYAQSVWSSPTTQSFVQSITSSPYINRYTVGSALVLGAIGASALWKSWGASRANNYSFINTQIDTLAALPQSEWDLIDALNEKFKHNPNGYNPFSAHQKVTNLITKIRALHKVDRIKFAIYQDGGHYVVYPLAPGEMLEAVTDITFSNQPAPAQLKDGKRVVLPEPAASYRALPQGNGSRPSDSLADID